jgi:hypothetical protein
MLKNGLGSLQEKQAAAMCAGVVAALESSSSVHGIEDAVHAAGRAVTRHPKVADCRFRRGMTGGFQDIACIPSSYSYVILPICESSFWAICVKYGNFGADFPETKFINDSSKIFDVGLDDFRRTAPPEWATSCTVIESAAGIDLAKNRHACRTAAIEARGTVPEMSAQFLTKTGGA